MTEHNFFAQHNQIVWISEYPGIFFEQVSGGEMSNDTSTTYPGGGGPHVVVSGPSSVGQLSLSKAYDPVRDAPLDAWAAAWQRGVLQRLTVVKQPVTPEGIPMGAPVTYIRCARISYKRPDLQKGSSEAAQLEITLQPEDVL